MAKLSEICDVRDGTHDSPKYVEYGYPLVTSKNIVDGKLDLTTVSYISEEDYNKINERSKVDSGDIIMPMIGTIGNPCLIEDEPNFAIKNVALIKFPQKNVSNKYIYYYLKSERFYRYVTENNRGGTQKFLSLKDVRNIDIPVPNVNCQHKIVETFEKLDSLIYMRQKQLSKLDELVKSRFIELFGDVANSPKYSGVQLGTICSTLSGGTPTTKIPEYYQGDIPWISTPYLGNNHINGSSAKAYITEDAIKNSATHLIPANTIMFGIRVGVGKSSIIDEPMCANQDIVALMGIDTNKYNLLFVKHVLDGYQSHFDSIKKGATILGITTDDLKKVMIPVVGMELQNQFASFVEQTDKSKLAVQKSLEQLEILKKSLMQQYFG